MQVMINKANSRYKPLEGHETSLEPLVLEVEWVTCEQESIFRKEQEKWNWKRKIFVKY